MKAESFKNQFGSLSIQGKLTVSSASYYSRAIVFFIESGALLTHYILSDSTAQLKSNCDSKTHLDSPYHHMSFHAIPSDTISFYVILYYSMSFNVIMSFSIIQNHLMSVHVILCCSMSFHIIPCHSISFHIIPCHFLSFHAIPSHSI